MRFSYTQHLMNSIQEALGSNPQITIPGRGAAYNVSGEIYRSDIDPGHSGIAEIMQIDLLQAFTSSPTIVHRLDWQYKCSGEVDWTSFLKHKVQATNIGSTVINAPDTVTYDVNYDRTIDMSNINPAPGAVYKVTIISTVFSYTALLTDSVADIATGLAASIDAAAAFVATATNGIITITTGAGTSTIVASSTEFTAYASIRKSEVVETSLQCPIQVRLMSVTDLDSITESFINSGGADYPCSVRLIGNIED